MPCSIGSPFLLNFLKLLTSPSTKPKLMAIWIGLSVPQTKGKKMTVRAAGPRKRPRIHTLMAPAFSAENKLYANAGEVTASVAKEVEATKAFSFTDSCCTWREGERGGKCVNNPESTEREREREREKKKGERRAHPHPHPSTEIRVREKSNRTREKKNIFVSHVPWFPQRPR